MISFIFADLLIIPILNTYLKDYGGRMAAFLFVTSYVAMVLAGSAVEVLFGARHLIPPARVAIVSDPQITFNYTTVLNLAFLALAAVLVIRAMNTRVGSMLRMMGGPPDASPSVQTDGAYHCPMHPSVRSDHAERCPRCGTALERDAPVAVEAPRLYAHLQDSPVSSCNLWMSWGG